MKTGLLMMLAPLEATTAQRKGIALARFFGRLTLLTGLATIITVALIGCFSSTSATSTYSTDKTPVTTYQPPARAVQVQRIAIIPFKDKTTHSPIKGDLGNIAVDQLTTLLVNSGRFDVVERERLDAVLNEQGLAGKGIVDQASAAQVGKVLGVQYIFTGAVTNWEVKKSRTGTFVIAGGKETAELDIDLAVDGRIINSTTGSIIAADSGEIKRTEKLSATMILSFGADGYVKLEQSVAGKQLRLALDNMLSKMMPVIDAKFSR
jgi:curli biogenesis system outer membrane secretion channel CsgG